MIPGLDYCSPAGTQAFCTVTFVKQPIAAVGVTINGTSFVWGVDFFGNNLNGCAQGLAAAINADVSRQGLHTAVNPRRTFYAVYFGNSVTVISLLPGAYGNSLSLTTTAGYFSVTNSGNFSGAIGDDSLGANSAVQTTQVTLAANNKRKRFMVQNCNTAVLNMRLGAAASASSFTRVLAACTWVDDDKGGIYPWDYDYKGQVTFFSATTYRYAVTEMVLP